MVYATDTEHYGDRIDENLVALAEGADLLIYDAQYTPEEYAGVIGGSRVGWGHSTWVEGVRIARAAGVGSLVLFHHDPAHDDAAIARDRARGADRPARDGGGARGAGDPPGRPGAEQGGVKPARRSTR